LQTLSSHLAAVSNVRADRVARVCAGAAQALAALGEKMAVLGYDEASTGASRRASRAAAQRKVGSSRRGAEVGAYEEEARSAGSLIESREESLRGDRYRRRRCSAARGAAGGGARLTEAERDAPYPSEVDAATRELGAAHPGWIAAGAGKVGGGEAGGAEYSLAQKPLRRLRGSSARRIQALIIETHPGSRWRRTRSWGMTENG